MTDPTVAKAQASSADTEIPPVRPRFGRVLLRVWLCALAACISMAAIYKIREYLTMSAQRPLSDIARRMLPDMQKRVFSIALSLQGPKPAEELGAPTSLEHEQKITEDPTQTIGFPFLLYEFKYGAWKDGPWNLFINGPYFVGGRNSEPVSLEGTARLAEDDAGGAPQVDFFEVPELVKANPHVDVSQVRTFVVVFVDPFQTEAYAPAGSLSGPGTRKELTTSSLRVYVVDRFSLKVTAYQLFKPDRLPGSYNSSEYNPAVGADSLIEGAMYYWLGGLRSLPAKD